MVLLCSLLLVNMRPLKFGQYFVAPRGQLDVGNYGCALPSAVRLVLSKFKRSVHGTRMPYKILRFFPTGVDFSSDCGILSVKKDGSFNTEGTVLPEVTCEKSFFLSYITILFLFVNNSLR